MQRPQTEPIPWIVQTDDGPIGTLERDADERLFLQLATGERLPIALDELRARHDGTMLLSRTLADLRDRIAPDVRDRSSPAVRDRSAPNVVSAATVPVTPATRTMPGLAPSTTDLAPSMSKVTTSDEVTIPVVEESVHVEKLSTPIGSVQLHVVPEQRTEHLQIPISTEHAEVRTVEVRRFVEEAPPVREEGDTLIVPIVEEVLVVHKRLMVREEIHIVRRRATHVDERDVVLRSEKVEITRQKP